MLRVRPTAVERDESLHQQAEERVAVAEIGEWGGHAAQLPEQSRPPEHPVAQAAAFLAGALVLGAPDVLLDADLRRAGHLAKLASGTEVEARGDGRLLRRAKPFHIRAERLRTPKDIGGSRHGADGIAGGALGAGLDGGFFLRAEHGAAEVDED